MEHLHNMEPVGIGIVGCGFVADFYLATLAAHPELRLGGVMDRMPERAERFARFHQVPRYESLRALLDDPRIDIVLNLTNPDSHFEVSRAALQADKHVYSEKPLAMSVEEAQVLVELAQARGRLLSGAPCSLLGETAQTVARALREEKIGKVRLVYAEMDDGLVHRMPYRLWHSAAGAPWPYEDEFAVGCTIEHAGYYLSWLPAFFGAAQQVTAFSACLVPEKQENPQAACGPDFSVACIRFASGVVARLTCSIVAPRDRSLRIIGDTGTLHVDDCWDYRAPVYIRRSFNLRRRTLTYPWKWRCPLPRSSALPSGKLRHGHPMDFCRGVADLARAIRENRPPRLSAAYGLHVTELVLRISQALETGASCRLTTTLASDQLLLPVA